MKIRLAFIYKGSHVFFSGKHFDNTYYHFFIDALKRNECLDVTYFPVENYFDASKLKEELHWKPEETLDTGLLKTVLWYLENESWVNHTMSAEYQHWIQRQYS